MHKTCDCEVRQQGQLHSGTLAARSMELRVPAEVSVPVPLRFLPTPRSTPSLPTFGEVAVDALVSVPVRVHLQPMSQPAPPPPTTDAEAVGASQVGDTLSAPDVFGATDGSPSRQSSQETGWVGEPPPVLPVGWQDLFQSIILKANLWSVGSSMHGIGECKPCHYAHTKEGCRSGAKCGFCHMPHTIPREAAMISSTRRRQCMFVARLLEEAEQRESPGYEHVAAILTSDSQFLEDRLKARRLSTQKETRRELARSSRMTSQTDVMSTWVHVSL